MQSGWPCRFGGVRSTPLHHVVRPFRIPAYSDGPIHPPIHLYVCNNSRTTERFFVKFGIINFTKSFVVLSSKCPFTCFCALIVRNPPIIMYRSRRYYGGECNVFDVHCLVQFSSLLLLRNCTVSCPLSCSVLIIITAPKLYSLWQPSVDSSQHGRCVRTRLILEDVVLGENTTWKRLLTV